MCGRDLEVDGFTVSDGGNVYSIEDVEIRDHIHTNCHYDFFRNKVRLKKVRVLRSAILLKKTWDLGTKFNLRMMEGR